MKTKIEIKHNFENGDVIEMLEHYCLSDIYK